jgi:hypothetical protein
MPTTTVTKYYSVNGQIIGEKVGSNPRTDYLTDALGSVTATVDQNAAIVNTYRYKPYGTQLSKTGSGSDPAFRWVGSHGYRQTSLNQSDVYVRARHYSSAIGMWSVRDRWWPVQPSYVYGRATPAFLADPSGEAPVSCANLTSCLTTWNRHGKNCLCGDKGQADVALALCVFYYECRNLDPDNCSGNDNGGGLGQLTQIAIDQLVIWCCNRGVTEKSDATGAGWCKGAQAAYNYLDCVGLDGYGPPYSDEVQKEIRACAECIRKKQGDCRSCGKKYIGS